jgi:hypothetical protein
VKVHVVATVAAAVGVRAVKVATPATAAFVFPVSETDPESLVAVIVSVELKMFPYWSRISSTGCVRSGLPDVAPAGCVRMRSEAAYGAAGSGGTPGVAPPDCVVPKRE